MNPEQILTMVFDILSALVMVAVFLCVDKIDSFSAGVSGFGLFCIVGYFCSASRFLGSCANTNTIVLPNQKTQADIYKNLATLALNSATVSFLVLVIWNLLVKSHVV